MNKFCKDCGKKVFNSDFCQNCDSSSLKRNNTPANNHFYENTTLNDSPNISQKKEENLKGLGGWLVIVFMVMLYLIYMYGTLAYSSIKMFTDGTVESVSGIKGYAGALGFEVAVQMLLFLSLTYLIFLFLKKDKKFPQLYIIFLILNAIFIAVDTYIIAYGLNYPTNEIKQLMQEPIQEGWSQLVKGIISGIIWISYMKVSERVRLTFVK